ncbi:DUF6096 family protein [Carnobacterium divergens]|uniref:DUF6096 family protein n=1 Tax=Carnobacterium divergens TaxID=2748 RepID=UPI0039C8D9CB
MTNLKNTKAVAFGGLNLKLRLDGRSILAIEKRLDKSLLSLFLGSQGGMKLPPSNELLIVLQGANQAHGIKDEDIIGAFENFLDSGKTTMDLQSIIQELLEDAGFFGKDKKEEASTDTVSLETQAEPAEESIL